MEKYTIIENDIIECINSGKLKNGEKIHSERELCEKYKVSRTTVRKALANLSTSGKIIRKIGDGSYVNEQEFVNNTGRALSFTEDMEKNGKVPGSQVLNFKVSTGASNPEIAQHLKLKKNESFYEIERLRTGDGVPIALSYTYIPFKMMPEFDIEKAQSSLYEYFKKNFSIDLSFPTREKTIAAVFPTKSQKKLLQISNEPLLKICHPSYTTDGKIFEYTETYYVGSRFVYKTV